MESGLPDRTKSGSSLRHWPPGTNSKTFVPSFFAYFLQNIIISDSDIATSFLRLPFLFFSGLK
jgi:hypothetical protein